uniref:Xylanolytic transcriptional activator regulatory domain-containing protein n=1 Tax=Bionectria ochroleuca TaxID=29856 RepID=A0A8H7KF67_BIOOC
MTGLFAAHVFAPVSLSREVQSAIPAYLDVYWDRTYPVYPYIHKASFDGLFDGEATPFELLKCAMAALATQFLDDRANRIAGSELHAFACQELKTFTEGKHWSLPIMQAVVCCEYYARFRGRDKQSYRPSSNYRKVYEMLVEKHHTFSLPLPVLGNKLLSWKDWVETETRRRLLATCFMLDVHTSAYFKEPPILALGPDHPSLPMNQVPFSTNTNPLWECPDWESWSRLVASDPSLGIPLGRTLADEFTPQDVATMSGFDATILMTGYASQLAGSGEMDAGEAFSSPSSPAFRLAKLFPASGVAQAYLAIHFTPLHALLSVSGNSWVLNRKVPGPNEFREHKQTLDKWCQSESAAVAVSWAARALLVFLRIRAKTRRTSEAGSSSSDVDSSTLPRGSRARWRDVSDYWGCTCARSSAGRLGGRLVISTGRTTEKAQPRTTRHRGVRRHGGYWRQRSGGRSSCSSGGRGGVSAGWSAWLAIS